MSLRKLTKSDFVGKTITDANVKAANFIQLKFSDDTSLSISTDHMCYGIWGMYFDPTPFEEEDQ